MNYKLSKLLSRKYRYDKSWMTNLCTARKVHAARSSPPILYLFHINYPLSSNQSYREPKKNTYNTQKKHIII